MTTLEKAVTLFVTLFKSGLLVAGLYLGIRGITYVPAAMEALHVPTPVRQCLGLLTMSFGCLWYLSNLNKLNKK